jgi:hypothetical protein
MAQSIASTRKDHRELGDDDVLGLVAAEETG